MNAGLPNWAPKELSSKLKEYRERAEKAKKAKSVDPKTLAQPSTVPGNLTAIYHGPLTRGPDGLSEQVLTRSIWKE